MSRRWQGEGLEDGALQPHKAKIEEAKDAVMKKILAERAAAAAAVPAPAPETANGEVVPFKDLVVGLINDATLSVPVKRQISDLGKAYTPQDKKSSFGKLKDLVGKERIRRVMLALTAAGATVPAKRAAPEETQAETQTEKRYLQTIDEVAEEYMCPITFELPIDPVIAEDDRCYERCAIEEWFER